VTTELNAAADNPLVSVPDQVLISNGNFHPVVMTIAHDALRIALAQVGQLSERRMGHLWDAFFRHPVSSLPTVGYGLQLRYPAAALFPELKQLAAPASLDTPPLDLDVEDHGTSAPLSVRKTGRGRSACSRTCWRSSCCWPGTCWRRRPSRPRSAPARPRSLRTVEEAVAAADPYPDAVHRALRERFPGPPGNRDRRVRCVVGGAREGGPWEQGADMATRARWSWRWSRNRIEAELIAGLLRSHGVRAAVTGRRRRRPGTAVAAGTAFRVLRGPRRRGRSPASSSPTTPPVRPATVS
jgi:hypothetical protein